MRKAPQCAALGFQLIAQKLAIVVELLLGDIPEKQVIIYFTKRTKNFKENNKLIIYLSAVKVSYCF